jgi:hypothetical protein
MGQQANNGSRRASLDEKKVRAAGRQQKQVQNQIRDAFEEVPARGKTGGASGKSAGGEASGSGSDRIANVGRSTRPARKR